MCWFTFRSCWLCFLNIFDEWFSLIMKSTCLISSLVDQCSQCLLMGFDFALFLLSPLTASQNIKSLNVPVGQKATIYVTEHRQLSSTYFPPLKMFEWMEFSWRSHEYRGAGPFLHHNQMFCLTITNFIWKFHPRQSSQIFNDFPAEVILLD